ncbi:alpha/beta fold hydrolase [Demequina sp. NBRC 110054]|uniref:alpha/beta fold hydrolase n=1 Tax=Demequina sp. NBRC 110054 TaxID=1570343 RepID=UPI0013564A49|nr:alpha/beta hydrolase [Demequina sp. NBRC 110054]
MSTSVHVPRAARFRQAEVAMWAHRGLRPEERWVTVEELGIRVRALVHGEGRPVVFVHGTAKAAGVWAPLVAQMPGIKAIVLDRPGCGLSDPLPRMKVSPEGVRRAVDAYLTTVIDELADGRADVVGNSAGGMVALTYAAIRPDKVRTVIVEGVPAVEGMTLPLPLHAPRLSALQRVIVNYRVSERELKLAFRLVGHGDMVATKWMPPVDVAWRIALARHTDTYRNEMAMLGQTVTAAGPRPGWATSLDELESIEAPALWLIGKRDPFTPKVGVESWAERMPHSTLHVMPRQGHEPWMDDAAGNAGMIDQWWREIGEGPGLLDG